MESEEDQTESSRTRANESPARLLKRPRIEHSSLSPDDQAFIRGEMTFGDCTWKVKRKPDSAEEPDTKQQDQAVSQTVALVGTNVVQPKNINELPGRILMNILTQCVEADKETWQNSGGLLSYLIWTKRLVCREWNNLLNDSNNLIALKEHRQHVYQLAIMKFERGTDIIVFWNRQTNSRKFPRDKMKEKPISEELKNGISSAISLFEPEKFLLHSMAVKDDVLECLATRLALYPKGDQFEIYPAEGILRVFRDVDISSVTCHFEKIKVHAKYITDKVIQSMIVNLHKNNYEIVAEGMIPSDDVPISDISMVNFERIHIFKCYTCATPFAELLDAIERALENPPKRKWDLSLTDEVEGFEARVKALVTIRGYRIRREPHSLLAARKDRVRFEVVAVNEKLRIRVNVKEAANEEEEGH